MIDPMIIDARITDVRASNDGSNKYVNFVSLDVGEWTQTIPSQEWNGFQVGEDVLLTCFPGTDKGTRSGESASGRKYTMATSDLVLRVEQIDHAGK